MLAALCHLTSDCGYPPPQRVENCHTFRFFIFHPSQGHSPKGIIFCHTLFQVEIKGTTHGMRFKGLAVSTGGGMAKPEAALSDDLQEAQGRLGNKGGGFLEL